MYVHMYTVHTTWEIETALAINFLNTDFGTHKPRTRTGTSGTTTPEPTE